MRPKVFVCRLIPEKGLNMVKEFAEAEVWEEELPPPRSLILEKVKQIDGLLPLLTDKIDAEVMDAAPRLKVISNYAVGYDNIDVPAATQRGILVCNTPGVLTETTADLAWALLMAGARKIAQGDVFARSGKWRTWGPMLFLGYDVHNATLGIVGLGRIGAEMAKRAKGFSMRILYHDANRRPDLESELGVEYVTLEELLAEADFITLHCPLNEETRHLMGKEQFAKMKPTAVLINTSRGPVVDQKALYEALAQRRIGGAALDVTDPEPPAPDDPLLKLDNLTIVPHIGSASFATRTKMATMAAENLIAALSGKRPPNPVNPEVLDKG
jgi:glyoxylate reductase